MRESYLKFRARLQAAGWWPHGWVERGAWYSLGLAIGLFIIGLIVRMFSASASDNINGWVKFLLVDALLLFFIVGFRWSKRKLLWRLRNRLIVTYMFIGVIPAVLLVALVTFVLIVGVNLSANFNNLMVAIKLCIVLAVIFVCFSQVVPANHLPMIPQNTGKFGQFGWSGVFRATGVIFFAYIGFDAVSVAAQEARKGGCRRTR